MRPILITSICILFFGVLTAQTSKKIRVEPSKSFGGTASEFFHSVEYIPLETTKESAFGDIAQLAITDNGYVIYDDDTHSVLLFNANGKFVKKIVRSANEFPTIEYDKIRKEIRIIAFNPINQKTHTTCLSVKGEVVQNKTYMNNAEVQSQQESIITMGKGYWAKLNSLEISNRANRNDTLFNLISIYHNEKLYKKHLQINPAENKLFSMLDKTLAAPNYVNDNGTFYVSTPFEHVIYKVSKDDATPIYQLIFPANRSLSKNIYSSKENILVDSIKNKLVSDFKIITSVGNIFFNKSKLFFKINQQSYISNTNSSQGLSQYNFIYDTLTGKLSSFERISPDSTNYYLPMTGDGNLAVVKGLMYSEGYFFSKISSLKMFATHEKNKSRSPQYPEVLNNYFRNESRKSNPVIVKMKLKQ